MIAQFRTHDYNLGRCSIASTMPDLLSLSKHNRKLLLANGAANVGVWLLDSSAGELDGTTLSWSTRPRRTAFLSELSVQLGNSSLTAEFDCGPPGKLWTIELSCTERGAQQCDIDFWQEQPETRPRMGECSNALWKL